MKMTVGMIRKKIENLDDDTPVMVDQDNGYFQMEGDKIEYDEDLKVLEIYAWI